MAERYRLALVTDAWAPQVNGVVNTFNDDIDGDVRISLRAVDPVLFHPSARTGKNWNSATATGSPLSLRAQPGNLVGVAAARCPAPLPRNQTT